jgi:hypothetical protein
MNRRSIVMGCGIKVRGVEVPWLSWLQT